MAIQRGYTQKATAMMMAAACLFASFAWAQAAGGNKKTTAAVSDPILRAQLDVADGSMIESGVKSEAVRMYFEAARELRGGRTRSAEKHALRAVAMDARFADAEALAATAALAQRQFRRASVEAEDALQIDANDEKAWVILATADNYLAKYADAADALGHVRQQDRTTWQAAYQWARAEAGLNDAAQTLDWANRAALTAPPGFAPLHLLRASALLVGGFNTQAGDELQIYLQLTNKDAPERVELEDALRRIRGLPDGSGTGYNALAN